MTSRKVVITGAHSYLGQKVLRHLGDLGSFEIAAFITPWAKDDGLIQRPDIRYFKVDLREELRGEAAALLENADHVLHFAWIRVNDEEKALNENLSMFDNMKEHLQDPRRLVFISSVAASPETFSSYGRTKFRAASKLSAYGAVILVTGLIVDKEPKGPYKLLVNFVKKLPLSVRFTRNSVRVYPIRTGDFLDAITIVLKAHVPPGTYRVYPSNATDINDFLAELEKKYRRARIPFPVSYGLSMGSLKLLRRLGLMPATLGEKLLTFLYKDEAYLAQHKELPAAGDLDRPLSEMI